MQSAKIRSLKKKITANIFPKICYTDHLEVEDSGIDKDDASTDNEITSDRSSGQSVSAYAVVIEWQLKGT